MSINAFPVFTVRGPDQRMCGHQHQYQERAENCAVNAATRSRGRTFSVVKVEKLDNDCGTMTGVVSQFEYEPPVEPQVEEGDGNESA